MTEQSILDAINRRVLVEITYTDKEGATSKRLTEPYEIKNGKYYGYCKLKNGIRAFSVPNISKVKITDIPYTPRWNV